MDAALEREDLDGDGYVEYVEFMAVKTRLHKLVGMPATEEDRHPNRQPGGPPSPDSPPAAPPSVRGRIEKELFPLPKHQH